MGRLWHRPLIEPRELWKEEKKEPGHDPGEAITRPLYPDRADTLVYTEKGEVCCVCPETGEQQRLAFQGFEAKRGRLKYRCPAAACLLTLPLSLPNNNVLGKGLALLNWDWLGVL